MQIPKDVQLIINVLENAGHEAYAVGGCVRDMLLGREPKDWDITTSALPQEIKSLFRRTIDTGIEHGTVTVMIGKTGYEVTTYRLDGTYSDGRHPDKVTFTPSLSEDLKRRDFTINAMAYRPSTGLVDLFGGQADLAARTLRCVGDPMERFTEDALRMLRAVRFCAQLDFSMEEKTQEAIVALAPNLEKISKERIQAELMKLISSPHPEQIRVAYETGITAVVLPEFDRMMKTPQKNRFHSLNVGDHTILAMQAVKDDPLLRLTMLLHDVGKPDCRWDDERGKIHFTNHGPVGAILAEDLLRRLKFDNRTIDDCTTLIRYHDALRGCTSPFTNPPSVNRKGLRRVISQVGKDRFPLLLAVTRADNSAKNQSARIRILPCMDLAEKEYLDILAKDECLSLKDLAIGGRDLIALGIPAGPRVGSLLKSCLELVLEDPSKNDRETLIAYVQSQGIRS